MRTNMHLLFYLKKRTGYQSGPVAIYLRFGYAGQRSETSTGRSCEPSRWNAAAGRMSGTREDARTLNAYLDSLQSQAQSLYQAMLASDEVLTAENIRNRFTGKGEKLRTLVSVFSDHNEKMASLVGREFEKSTLTRYKTCLMHVQDFLKLEYNLTDIPVAKITFEFLTSFEYYLRSIRKCANNSAIKYVKNLRKIVRICLGNGWLAIDPYINYKPKTKKTHRVVLSKEELVRLIQKEFTIERLDLVRDIFVFSCYTGLAYADARKLKRSEVTFGIDGNRWIHTARKKTDTISRVPVLPVALSIMEKYANNPQCVSKGLVLPVMSNQKMNAYLKEIADLCGIHKPLTFHIARHTFATTVTLSNGVPIESVSKMIGHTSIKTTQIYAQVLDHKISEDMQMLMNKLVAS